MKTIKKLIDEHVVSFNPTDKNLKINKNYFYEPHSRKETITLKKFFYDCFGIKLKIKNISNKDGHKYRQITWVGGKTPYRVISLLKNYLLNNFGKHSEYICYGGTIISKTSVIEFIHTETIDFVEIFTTYLFDGNNLLSDFTCTNDNIHSYHDGVGGLIKFESDVDIHTPYDFGYKILESIDFDFNTDFNIWRLDNIPLLELLHINFSLVNTETQELIIFSKDVVK